MPARLLSRGYGKMSDTTTMEPPPAPPAQQSSQDNFPDPSADDISKTISSAMSESDRKYLDTPRRPRKRRPPRRQPRSPRSGTARSRSMTTSLRRWSKRGGGGRRAASRGEDGIRQGQERRQVEAIPGSLPGEPEAQEREPDPQGAARQAEGPDRAQHPAPARAGARQ